MSNVITITLPSENRAALEELKPERVDEIVNQALADYLFIRRFRDLHARMTRGMERFGVRSDDDVFALVS